MSDVCQIYFPNALFANLHASLVLISADATVAV